VADRDERAGHLDLALLAGLRVAQAGGLELRRALERLDGVRGEDLDVRLLRARSSMIFDARNSSRRWMTVTFEPNFARKIASSMAESPPPTTAIGFSLKNAASQVAQ
jgi:hypothetical protein